MSFLKSNIRYLRKKKQLTQAQLAEKIGVKRAVIGTYEEGKAEPKLNTLRLLARFFKCTIDELIEVSLDVDSKSEVDFSGNGLRILPIVVDESTNDENVLLVPIKASAGYLNGYSDPDFIESLPQFKLPLPELSAKRTYRVFQTNGDSMLPIESGSYIITEYLNDWTELTDFKCAIIVTKNEGVVFKRVINKIKSSQELILLSDNTEYEPYKVGTEEIIEIWTALGSINFNISTKKQHFINLQKIHESILEIKTDLSELKSLR